MTERRQAGGISPSQFLARPEISLEADHSQGHNCANFLKTFEFLQKVRAATVEFFGGRFVVRGRAMNGCCDVAVDELKTVVAIYGMRLIRKAKAVQGAIKPISGAIAGEDATGAIASVSCGCESNDEQPGVEASQTWYGPSPVFLIPKAADFSPRDLLAVGSQTRAEAARFDLVLRPAATFRQGLEES
jgi:hypothetical protein